MAHPLTSRSGLPLSELRSVRRALHSLFPADRCRTIASASKKGSGGKSRRYDGDEPLERRAGGASKGFGAPIKETKPPPKAFEDVNDGDEDGSESFVARSEYQIYSDAEFKPKRFVGAVEAVQIEGQGRGLVANSAINPGDLLLLLPALAFLEGDFQEAPQPEDLHIAMLEDGLTAAQRRILDVMYDGTQASQMQPVSLTTLDVKFWSSRGANDAAAPSVDAKRLLEIIRHCCCTDTQQDTAAMQVRQQMPCGFIGLWPEFSLISHSCAPNTTLAVIGDRMLVHAATELQPGEQLTRNCIGAAVTGPLAARQAAVMEQRGARCNCPRCKVEENASETVKEVLADAFSWYLDEGLPQWNSCQEREDLEGLRSLCEEAEQIVSEVEEAVEAEEGLDEEQRMWLRASAYDCYDMLVMCDEFLNQDKSNPAHVRACLELIRIFAPGSESHTAVAIKYEAVTRTRAELAEYLATQELQEKQQSRRKKLGLGCKGGMGSGALVAVRQARELKVAADEASELYLEAFFTRYGFLNLKQLETLREGLEMFNEALEQMSLMKAEGKTESQTDYVIDGVTFSLVDKLGSLGGVDKGSGDGRADRSPAGAGGRGSGDKESGFEVANQDGVRLMIMDPLERQEGGEGAGRGDSEAIEVEEVQEVGDVLDVGSGEGSSGDAEQMEGEEEEEEEQEKSQGAAGRVQGRDGAPAGHGSALRRRLVRRVRKTRE